MASQRYRPLKGLVLELQLVSSTLFPQTGSVTTRPQPLQQPREDKCSFMVGATEGSKFLSSLFWQGGSTEIVLLQAAKPHICPENLSLSRESSRSRSWPPGLFTYSKRGREGSRAQGIRISSQLLQPPPSGTLRHQARHQASSRPAALRGAIQVCTHLPLARPGWGRHGIWQEQSSLLILASSSPPRQLESCGKLGSTEVRAGDSVFKRPACCQLNINPRRAGDGARPRHSSPETCCWSSPAAQRAKNPKSLTGSHVLHIFTVMSICEDEAGNHMLQVVQSSAAQSGTELSTGKPDVLTGTAAVKSHHGTNFRGIKHPCDSKHALSHLSRVAYSPISFCNYYPCIFLFKTQSQQFTL